MVKTIDDESRGKKDQRSPHKHLEVHKQRLIYLLVEYQLLLAETGTIFSGRKKTIFCIRTQM